MNSIETALLLLALATLIVAGAPRLKLPAEVLLIIGSLVLSVFPGLPTVSLQPEIVFIVFLPPIIFAAAYFTSWRDFKANRRPIGLLAVGLVLFTTCGVAAVMKWLIPQMPWSIGFLLGAIVSPPDASAATAITRQLGIPRRIITILEGESLVNDATALVAYKFAIAATITGQFSLGMAALKFLMVGVGGVAVGLFTGWVGIGLYRSLHDVRAQTLVSFLTAFACYLSAESIGVSGVIATVVGGLYFGRWLPARGTAEVRIEAQAGWDLMLFIINALVFTLIGFQLPVVLRNLQHTPGHHLVAIGMAIGALVILLRPIWVVPATVIPRWLFPSVRKRDPMPPWSAIFVISWTGMRGIVSLAAALSIPAVLPSGEVFPYRDLLIFVTYVVILATLLIPSLTLPALMKRIGLPKDQEPEREEAKARIASVRAVLDDLPRLRQEAKYQADHLTQVEKIYTRRLQTLEANLTEAAYSPLFDEDSHRRRLMRDLVVKERTALIQLRDQGAIHDEIVHAILRELDLEELRLRTQRL